ncbi:hypothetical protein HPB52_002108 [Rhipicephalus sanguineus]|uniref:Uncharacterized protein n=1 Tax=Rhipicephalus sanguineus TaxID=34632 RepID=A0A9D4SVG6_RHISA|nr:hypothetical protein HPB52_002108 [Rhipicephalus sanguineus]
MRANRCACPEQHRASALATSLAWNSSALPSLSCEGTGEEHHRNWVEPVSEPPTEPDGEMPSVKLMLLIIAYQLLQQYHHSRKQLTSPLDIVGSIRSAKTLNMMKDVT